MASKYWEDVKKIVRVLFDLQKTEWSRWETKEQGRSSDQLSPALQAREVMFARGARWMSINDTKLDSMFDRESRIVFSSNRLVLALPPFPKEQREFVPVLTLMYDPAKECIKIRVAMYRLQEDGSLCGFGFRLESPTSGCENGETTTGIHDFYHVQFMKHLESYAPQLNMPVWLPEYQPSISVRAGNPTEAILCLVLSLYGLDYFKQMMRQVGSGIWSSKIPMIGPLLR